MAGMHFMKVPGESVDGSRLVKGRRCDINFAVISILVKLNIVRGNHLTKLSRGHNTDSCGKPNGE